MTPRRNTKEDILQASLRLFARAGFEATGMREIAAAVGIQPASVYKHFAGKQAILDAIVERMDERYDLTAAAIGMPEGGMDEQTRGYAATPVAQMADLGEAMFRYWTEDEFATLFRQMLTVEQYRTPELGALYRRYFIETPLAWQEGLFASMMEAGAFMRDDPRLLALEFFAPLMLLIQAADGDVKRAEKGIIYIDERERLVDLARQHVTRFGERHACALGAERPE